MLDCIKKRITVEIALLKFGNGHKFENFAHKCIYFKVTQV